MNSLRFWKRFWPDRRLAGNCALLALFLALAGQASAPTMAQSVCGSYAVATAPQPPGHPLSDNVITLNSAVGTITQGDFPEPRTVEPSPKPGVALARSLGGVYALMDIETGAITPIRIPDDEQARISPTDPTISNAPESDFLLLAGGPTSVWLVDLSSGDALDLTTLDESGEQLVDTAAISPDGDWLLTFHGQAGSLISLRTSTDPMTIDREPLLPFPSFDAQNNVLYAVSTGESATLRSLDPRSGVRTTLATVPGQPTLARTNGSPTLLVGNTELAVMSPGASTLEPLFSWTNGPGAVLTNEDGTQLLVSDNSEEGPKWFLIDVASGAGREIHELAKLAPLIRSARADAVLFTPIPPVGPGRPGTPYYSFDFASGQVKSPLLQDSDQVYRVDVAGDDAGRYTIVNAVAPGQGRVWLIDNAIGIATEIATSTGNASARVSPDGCQLAVAVYDTVGEGRTSDVTVTSLVDGTTTMTIPDALLLGWAAV